MFPTQKQALNLYFALRLVQCGEARLSVRPLIYGYDQPASPSEAGASAETMIGRPARQASPHCEQAKPLLIFK